MKTRFDNYGVWITAMGEVRKVSDMDTSHILNTMRMLIQKPSRTVGMLIHDVEHSECCVFSAWEPNFKATVEQSIYNITSMTMDELKSYVKRTPLFQSKAMAVMQEIADNDRLRKQLDAKDKAVRQELQEAMDKYGIKKFENDILKVTYVEPTTRSTIDSKKLKEELPAIAEKYTKTTVVKGSVRIEVK